MTNFVIETQHLYKRFGQVTALEDINIQIKQGEFVAIMGASGSGKTTLMNILTGLDTASEGKVILDGVDAAQLDEVGRQRFRAEKIGLVFQQFHLIPYLTALENVMLAQHYHSVIDEASAKAVLEQVGLTGLEDRNVYSLSGGQRQRLAIASVLAVNPSILVLDEPTSSLDPEGTEELYRLVGSLNRDHGITVVVIDHDLHAVLPYANRMVLIDGGELKIDSSVENVLSYMYDTNTYVDALPSLFVTYKSLAAKGIALDTPWLSLASAKSSLMKGER